MAVLPAGTMVRRKPEIEQRIHAALEEERAKHADSAFTVRLSSIGKCQRELWAIRMGIPDEKPPNGRALMTFDVGSYLEGAVVDWLRSAGYKVLTQGADGEQIAVAMPKRVGVGHIDGLILWGRPSDGDWRLLEIKTAKAERFQKLVEAGSYKDWDSGYYDQIQAYMGAHSPSLDDCLVLVLNKNTSEIWPEMVRFNAERYAELEEKAKLVVESETIVPKPAAANSQYCAHCKWCGRNQWCWSPLSEAVFDE